MRVSFAIIASAAAALRADALVNLRVAPADLTRGARDVFPVALGMLPGDAATVKVTGP